MTTSIPVSSTATLILTEPRPLPDFVLLRSPSMRSMPVGMHCTDGLKSWGVHTPSTNISRSSDTNSTRLSAWIAASAAGGKPGGVAVQGVLIAEVDWRAQHPCVLSRDRLAIHTIL